MKLILFISLFIIQSTLFSQEIISATKQDWVGGPCCVSGTNYVVTIISDKPIASTKIKSILLKKHGAVYGEATIKENYIKIYFTVSVNNHILDFDENNGNRIKLEEALTIEGEGLLEIFINRKLYSFPISSFAKAGDPIMMQ